jgi:hypothetical protein
MSSARALVSHAARQVPVPDTNSRSRLKVMVALYSRSLRRIERIRRAAHVVTSLIHPHHSPTGEPAVAKSKHSGHWPPIAPDG